jgi:two-component system CheB/CheR fusion protein
LQGVSQRHLDRFFSKQEGSYTVAKEIRDLYIFSTHSVIRDPPFSRLDLIFCRNLLIYLGNDFQATRFSFRAQARRVPVPGLI